MIDPAWENNLQIEQNIKSMYSKFRSLDFRYIHRLKIACYLCVSVVFTLGVNIKLKTIFNSLISVL